MSSDCEYCLRPLATDADDAAYTAICDGAKRPDDWPNDEATHLCWRNLGGECFTPDWFDAVTPAEVLRLREAIAGLEGEVARLREEIGKWQEDALLRLDRDARDTAERKLADAAEETKNLRLLLFASEELGKAVRGKLADAVGLLREGEAVVSNLMYPNDSGDCNGRRDWDRAGDFLAEDWDEIFASTHKEATR